MSDVPCGCDLIEQARLTKDRRIKAQKQSDGEHFQKVWNCPRRSGAPDKCQPVTDPAALAALENVETLTGAGELTTCPVYYPRLEWLGDVVKLRRWWKSGQLGMRMSHPPAVIVDAIDCIEDSVSMRESWEFDRAKEDRERSAPRPPGHGHTPPQPGPPKP